MNLRAEIMAGGVSLGTKRPELLTTAETAELLRLKERKIYDLVASGDIPHVRVTGKLLFPRVLIDGWIARHTMGDAKQPVPAPPPICAGSHDPLLEWALGESGCGIATFCNGSLDGLARMASNEALMAGLHLPDEAENEFNIDAVNRTLPGHPSVIIEWAWRTQGLILPPGNPLNIQSVADLEGRRIAPRQREAGTFLLLLRLMQAAGLENEAIVLLDPPLRSENDVALAIADGKADAGLGLQAAAKRFRLDFVPLAEERFDLVLWRRSYFESPMQTLLDFCRCDRFRHHANELTGYRIENLGAVRFNAP